MGAMQRLSIVLLFASADLLISTSASVVRQHSCDYEGNSLCGWVPGPPPGRGMSGIANASHPPTLGPHIDADPGTPDGHYFYFYTPNLQQTVQILRFPSHRYVCQLAFTYYPVGAFDFEIHRENLDLESVPFNETYTSNTSYWRTVSFNYTVHTTPADLGALVFDISEYDLGEAVEEGSDYDLFLGLDGVNLTFCLPCDFDSLSTPGNLILDAPQNVSVTLRASQSFTLNASSPSCPNETRVFGIKSVQPNHLSSIFTLDSTTGQLVVDGRGRGLDANGTMGTITVSVHVPGSNYTNTDEPFKQTAAIPFYQPPTITVDAPSNISVRANTSFSFQVSSTSALGVPLQYGTLVTNPPQLINDLTVSSPFNRVLTIRGTLSLSMLSQIIQLQITVPTVTVRVTDTFGGTIVRTTAILIQESAPIFNQSGYVFNILENQHTPSVGAFSVIDPNTDLLDSPQFVAPNSNFFIVSTSAPSCTVCEYTILTTMPSFDYETQTQYNLVIEVQDSLNQLLRSSATVTINVLPVNEFPPVFTQLRFVAHLSDVAPVGSFIAEPRANDPDHGPDGDITYSISSGNEDGFFNISAMFGTVTVVHSPLLPQTYTLTITATDHGTPPLSSRQNATVVVTVTASVPVNCNDQQYGPPIVSSQGGQPQEKVGSNITLPCVYTANPTVRITKWHFREFITGSSSLILMGDTSGHYSVERNSLTVYNLTAADGGLYTCNVTNQCGSDQTSYHVIIIDLPRPPSNVEVINGPYERNVTLSWTLPTEGGGGISVLRPVDEFIVQVRDTREGESYRNVMRVRSNVTTVVVEGLDPGTEYEVRVVSTNEAGQTPSDVILINTTATVPQLLYLRARALQNLSLLIEWQLEYDGGFPVSNFLITVRVQLPRQRRNTPEFLHFEVSVDTMRLVTGALEQGRIYTVNSEVTNQLGSSQRSGNVFVGQTDSVQCNFELTDGCPWQLGVGVSVVMAGESGALNIDASSDLRGHYVSAELDPSQSSSSELVIVSYSAAAYICNYTFSYQVRNGAKLVLRDSSGAVIWSSGTSNQDTRQWVHVTLPRKDVHYLTDQSSDELQFVLVRPATNVNSGTLRVFLDDVNVDFCLPCDFQQLQSSENFHLSYTNYSTIYLRIGQMLSIETVVRGCPDNLLLNFSITRVVPNDLYSSFSVTNQDTTGATIAVSPISTDLAAPNTAGFLEVQVSVAYSDYRQEGMVISRVAEIQFKLLQTNENCSFTQTCDFEDGPCIWELGGGVSIMNSSSSPLSSLTGTSGSHLYGNYPSSAMDPVTIATTTITDNHCAISFAYVASLVEMQITIEGLGSIWSSLTDSPEGLETPRWEREVVEIDLQGAMILNNRTLTFVADMTEAFGEAGADGGGYFALDNITLHPCSDCNTPDCSFSSCFPGHYFSLLEEGCVSCPPGYYCSDWRQPPRPCPPGTYSNSSQEITQTSCKPCPPQTYANRPASTLCLACPPGYNCSNPAAIPVATTCTSTSPLCPAGFTCGDDGSQQPCPQGEYSFEGQQTCQTCPDGFSCANSSVPPVPIPSTTSSSPTNCPTETPTQSATTSTTCTSTSPLCPAGFTCSDNGSQQPCPQGEYSFEGQQTCQTCPEGFSCANSSAPPVPIISTTSSPITCPTETPTEPASTFPLVPVVAGTVGGGLALLIIVTGCCVCCYCRRQRDKRIRHNRQRILASDRGSVDGSTLGRGSTFDSMGRRRWRTRGDTSTLMSYMTDDSTINPFYDEASWMETEELTKPEEEGTLSFQNTGFNEQAGGSITYRNTGFEEEEEEEGEEETELKESHWRLAPRHPTATASQF